MAANLRLIVVILISLPVDVYGANILLVPGNVNSHVMMFARLGVDMAKRGDHIVTVLAASSSRVPDFVTETIQNFTYVQYPVDSHTPFVNSPEASGRMVAMAMTKSVLELRSIMGKFNSRVMEFGEHECSVLQENIQLMQDIRQAGYEFAIMDPLFALACYYTVPYSLGIPYASMSAPFSPAHMFRLPRLYSFPGLLSASAKMTFFQRLSVFIAERMDSGIVGDSAPYMQKYVPHLPPLSAMELFQRQSLWFLVEDLSVSYPLPQMPNTLAVGDLMAGAKGNPLNGTIQEFVSKSTRGVVIAVFGSFCDYFPPEINQQLCQAFTEATIRLGVSIIWKLKAEGFCRHENILVLPWVPQNHLLADSRVLAFISHGGHNSIIESAYHAKPMIVFPLGLDQPANAAAAQSKGFAIHMDIADFTPESLVTNMEKLLSNPEFRQNAELASAILRDRRDTAAERVSAMIDHVITYGDQHLRTGAFELTTMQFLMLDIFAFLAAIAVLVSAVVVASCFCLFRTGCKYCIGRNSSAQKRKSLGDSFNY